jgi:lambda repressor-like predicted transcriptional regulator
MNLEKFLRQKGMTRLELAVSAKTSPNTLWLVEKYNHRPGRGVAERIAKALGVTPEDIWEDLGERR